MGSILAIHENQTFNHILMSMVQNVSGLPEMQQYAVEEVVQSLVDAATDGFNFSSTGPLLQPRHNKFCSWCAHALSVFSDAEDNVHGTEEDTEDDNGENINGDSRME